MIQFILHIIFCTPYLVIGVGIAAIIDISIYYTKVTSRFTLLQIWGCTLFWPIVLVTIVLAFIIGLTDQNQ